MSKPPTKSLEYARRLRRDMTDAERALWRLLRDRRFAGWRFRRQEPINRYIVDFVCFEARLVIEVDGGQHAESKTDTARDADLRTRGFHVLRLWNNDVLANPDGVYPTIDEALARCAPSVRVGGHSSTGGAAPSSSSA